MVKSDYYSSISKGYDELYKEEQLKKLKLILKNVKIKGRVLDVGCGTAFYSKYFQDYTGIDNSKGMLEKAKANVIYGRAEKLPFKDKGFDVIICLTAIHNFKDYKKALNEMKRVSKKLIIISLLKKTKKFNEIKRNINDMFKDIKKLNEEKDLIFIINQTSWMDYLNVLLLLLLYLNFFVMVDQKTV